MAIVAAALIGGAVGIAGDAIASSGQSATNQTNEQIAQMNNAFNAQQAAENRAFQASQSANAVQTRAEDLRKANLNPLLAVGNPAMAMGGSTASSAGLPNVQNPLSSASGLGGQVSSALSAAAQANSSQAQADLAASQKHSVDLDAQKKAAELPYAAPQAASAVENIQQQTDNLKRQWQLLGAEFDWRVENTANLMQNEEFNREAFPLQQKTRELDILGQKYGLPALATQSWFWNSPAAHATYAGQQVGDAIGSVISPATNALKSYSIFRPKTSQTSFFGPGGEDRGGSVTTQ